MNFLIAAIVGLVSGVTSGLFGVGGGIVMVPAMVFALRLDIKTAIGTSLAVIIPTALVGTLKHYQQGNVDWRTALSLVPMALIGGYLGALAAHALPSPTIKRAFGGFIILVGIRLLAGK
jgi:uncharacterized protein